MNGILEDTATPKLKIFYNSIFNIMIFNNAQNAKPNYKKIVDVIILLACNSYLYYLLVCSLEFVDISGAGSVEKNTLKIILIS